LLRNGHLEITTFDLGGPQYDHFLSHDYCSDPAGIVFVIDAANRERLSEAKTELLELLHSKELRGLPILVLGNKTDLPDALSEADLRREMYMCSRREDEGYRRGLEWLIAGEQHLSTSIPLLLTLQTSRYATIPR
jgi:GTP-binding protein SAR1